MVHDDPPTFEALERLAASADIRDRAFAASVLSLRRHTEDPAQIALLYARIREAARSHHAEVRKSIHEGTLDRRAFLANLRDAPLEIRDHLVEEILDIAYPQLEQALLPQGAVHYCPSGLAEILFMLDNANLGPDKTFVDLGSGLGKVVLLVALLTGARAYGVEIDPDLARHARSAARSLHLDNAHFIDGDIRNIPLPKADVYYMYSPLIQSTSVVARLMGFATRSVLIFSQTLDLQHLPGLRAVHAASYWLEMYEAKRAHAIAECERRIHDVRATVFATNDGVVPRRMTELEREWRTLAHSDHAG